MLMNLSKMLQIKIHARRVLSSLEDVRCDCVLWMHSISMRVNSAFLPLAAGDRPRANSHADTRLFSASDQGRRSSSSELFLQIRKTQHAVRRKFLQLRHMTHCCYIPVRTVQLRFTLFGGTKQMNQWTVKRIILNFFVTRIAIPWCILSPWSCGLVSDIDTTSGCTQVVTVVESSLFGCMYLQARTRSSKVETDDAEFASACVDYLHDCPRSISRGVLCMAFMTAIVRGLLQLALLDSWRVTFLRARRTLQQTACPG